MNKVDSLNSIISVEKKASFNCKDPGSIPSPGNSFFFLINELNWLQKYFSSDLDCIIFLKKEEEIPIIIVITIRIICFVILVVFLCFCGCCLGTNWRWDWKRAKKKKHCQPLLTIAIEVGKYHANWNSAQLLSLVQFQLVISVTEVIENHGKSPLSINRSWWCYYGN